MATKGSTSRASSRGHSIDGLGVTRARRKIQYSPDLPAKRVLLEGWLHKKKQFSVVGSSYSKRYFVLTDDELMYWQEAPPPPPRFHQPPPLPPCCP